MRKIVAIQHQEKIIDQIENNIKIEHAKHPLYDHNTHKYHNFHFRHQYLSIFLWQAYVSNKLLISDQYTFLLRRIFKLISFMQSHFLIVLFL